MAVTNARHDVAANKKRRAKLLKTLNDRAPSSRAQTGGFGGFGEYETILGQPYDPSNIPYSKLYQMRRHAMIAFATHFIKVPMIRAEWYMRCEDAKIAAHADAALRPIVGSLIMQMTEAYNFGHQAIVKRMEHAFPSETYIDPMADPDEKERPVWDEGNVPAIMFKPFVALRPERAWPIFRGNGDFGGIEYDVGDGSVTFPIIGETDRGRKIVPLEHSLWFTSGKEGVFGNIYGYPLIGHAYRYWWTDGYTWMMLNRHIEKDADPATVVYHPEESIVDEESGEVTTFADKALKLGEDARSNSTIALPNSVMEGLDGKPTRLREWEIQFLQGGGNFDVFMKLFSYLDIMLLRACMVPEQAIIEGPRGCIAADTPIACPRDHVKYPHGVPIKDMKRGDLLWAYNEDKSEFELRRAKNVWRTMKNAKVMKVTFDDGTFVRATPDHPFMLRNGEWKMLIELVPGDRLMPLLESTKSVGWKPPESTDFEPMITTDPDAPGHVEMEWKHAQRWLDPIVHDGKIDCHHRDRRHSNTNESNLELLPAHVHAHLHGMEDWDVPRRTKLKESVEKWWLENRDNEKGQASLAAARANFTARHALKGTDELKHTKATKRRISESAAAAARKHRESMTPEEYASYVKARNYNAAAARHANSKPIQLAAKNCVRCAAEYAPTSAAQLYCVACVDPKRQPFVGRIKSAQNYSPRSCRECGDEFKPRSGSHRRCDACLELALVPNHVVVTVEFDGECDVWDIEVDGPDEVSSFVANGVVVHNTSSKNVASEMGDVFFESQAVRMKEIDEHINRFVIMPWLQVNYPEYHGKCEKWTRGFGRYDETLAKQLVQLIGQTDPNQLEVDPRAILEQAGIPMLNRAAVAQRNMRIQQAIADETAASTPPTVEPVAGQTAGVVPVPAGGGAAFSHMYIQPRQRIVLSERRAFLGDVPTTVHVEDPEILASAMSLRDEWEHHLRTEYDAFASWLEEQSFVDLAADGAVKKAATLLARWKSDAKRVKAMSARLASFVRDVVWKSGAIELDKNKNDHVWDPSANDVAAWIRDRGAASLGQIEQTTRDEITRAVAKGIEEGKNAKQISAELRDAFDDRPAWRANRIARTEVVQAYNAGTLLAGKQAGVPTAQAVDASAGADKDADDECVQRNGRFYDIDDALREEEHPNGTLGWRLIPHANLSVRHVDIIPGMTGAAATFDRDESIVYARSGLEPRALSRYLLRLGEDLMTRAPRAIEPEPEPEPEPESEPELKSPTIAQLAEQLVAAMPTPAEHAKRKLHVKRGSNGLIETVEES